MNAKQKRFAKNIACGMAATDAYKDAYKPVDVTIGSINTLASRLLKKVEVSSYIDALIKDNTRKTFVDKAELIEIYSTGVRSSNSSYRDKVALGAEISKLMNLYTQVDKSEQVIKNETTIILSLDDKLKRIKEAVNATKQN